MLRFLRRFNPSPPVPPGTVPRGERPSLSSPTQPPPRPPTPHPHTPPIPPISQREITPHPPFPPHFGNETLHPPSPPSTRWVNWLRGVVMPEAFCKRGEEGSQGSRDSETPRPPPALQRGQDWALRCIAHRSRDLVCLSVRDHANRGCLRQKTGIVKVRP